MKTKHLNVKVDIVGNNLNKDDVFDRFLIMQNRNSFNCYLVNCLFYLLSKRVNGFFDMDIVLFTITKVLSNLFSCDEESQLFVKYILGQFNRFGIVKHKTIKDDLYIKSLIKEKDFNRYCVLAKEMCTDFDMVLEACTDVFEILLELISENDKSNNKGRKNG